jgi:tRNA(Ile2) C34 agmatinyltransferase TiaS
MTAALLEARPPSSDGVGARRQTLEERLQISWRLLMADGHAECPVCGATMQPEGATGRCGGCGSALS